ncbi:MAG: phenylalanine--tRNA ligase subunit beta [Firmicutes bacterium]|nr:phenylalanine--tRNA ligase subunit beta [Bacillota bacterium]
MKISLNILKQFVNLDGITPEEIISRFSLTTSEIDGYEVKGLGAPAIVAEIKTCEKVPNSSKLSQLTVFDGQKNHQVVCAAPNVRVGLRVAFAPKGSIVAGIELGVVKLAGVESHGMCLSGRELGISTDHDGIVELPSTSKIGEPITKALPFIVDTIFDFDNKGITNRPDLWGHYGLARELATIFNRPLKPLDRADLSIYSKLPKVPVKIESDKCFFYSALRIENITRKQSPLWMQTALFYLGINAHGYLVDLSNYLMLELGQPNHAFDASKMGVISIGHAPAGKKFMTLKDTEVTTTPEMLFIKSDETLVGLAGVVGGKNSQICSDTTDTIFEFATFDPTNIRRTASAIGLRTDASTRFEKSLDTNLAKLCAERTIFLLKQHDPKMRVASRFSFTKTKETKPIKIKVDRTYVEDFCGVKFDWNIVVKNLTALGFAPVLSAKALSITTPTWRATKDISMGADIIEEIMRTYGYDKIKPVPPTEAVKTVTQPPYRAGINRIKDILTTVHGLQEVHTYLWSEKPSDLRVVNSAIKGCDYVRDTMIPALVSIFKKNRASHTNIKIFEIGRVVLNGKEQRHLCICVPDYKELSEIVSDIIPCKFDIGKSGFHPKNNANIIVNGKVVGGIGVYVGVDMAVAEIVLDAIDPNLLVPEKLFPMPTKYQKNTLDFTFEHDGVYGEIKNVFDKFSHKYNMGFKLKDVYKNCFTVQFTVASHEKTLESEDINDIWQKIIDFGKANSLTLKS